MTILVVVWPIVTDTSASAAPAPMASVGPRMAQALDGAAAQSD